MLRSLSSLLVLLLSVALFACGGGNKRDTRGLLVAAEEGNILKVKEALETGCQPDDTLNVGDRTALLLASMNGHTEVVQLLLERGADPNAEYQGARVRLAFKSFVELMRSVHTKPDVNGTYVKQDGTKIELKSIPLRESQYEKILKMLDDAAAKQESPR